jgi:hypothetical protein
MGLKLSISENAVLSDFSNYACYSEEYRENLYFKIIYEIFLN